MSELKLAATIMLARDRDGVLEVLLLKRNKALAFAGGLWVFPGGKIENEELALGKDELAAAKLAAVRETKEESDVAIHVDDLIFFRHWTTPVIEPRRYATYFFFGTIPHADSKVTIDDSEIKQHRWISPQEALDQLRAGALAMMPPTLMSLQMICKCKTTAEAKALLQKETPIFILPVLQKVGSKMVCMYEGDAGYASGQAATAGARHRLVLDMAKGDFEFEFNNCDGFIPINSDM